MTLAFGLIVLIASIVSAQEIDIAHLVHLPTNHRWVEISHIGKEHNGRTIGEAERTLSTGHRVVLSYNYAKKSNCIMLDELTGFTMHSCYGDSVVLRIQNADLLRKFAVGHYLHANLGAFHCIHPVSGKLGAVTREITDVDYDEKTQLLTLTTREVHFHSMLSKDSTISVKIHPGNVGKDVFADGEPEHLAHVPELDTVHVAADGSRKRSISQIPNIPVSTTTKQVATGTNIVSVKGITVTCVSCSLTTSLGLVATYSSTKTDLYTVAGVSAGTFSLKYATAVNTRQASAQLGNGTNADFSTTLNFNLNGVAFTVTQSYAINFDFYFAVISAGTVNFRFTQAFQYQSGISYTSAAAPVAFTQQFITGGSLSANFNPLVAYTASSVDSTGASRTFTIGVKVVSNATFQNSLILTTQLPVQLAGSITQTSGSTCIGETFDYSLNSVVATLPPVPGGTVKIGTASYSPQLLQTQNAKTTLITKNSCPTLKRNVESIMALPSIYSKPLYNVSEWQGCDDPDVVCATGALMTRTYDCTIDGVVVPLEACGGLNPPRTTSFCDDDLCDIACDKLKDCGSCAFAYGCVWCTNTSASGSGVCKDDPDFDGTCPDGFITTDNCGATVRGEHLPHLTLDTSTAPPYNGEWLGGLEDASVFPSKIIGAVNVFVTDSAKSTYYQLANLRSLPGNNRDVPATGGFSFQFNPAGFPTGDYILQIRSTTKDSNTAEVNFTLSSVVAGSSTVVSEWGGCDRLCGGGVRMRTVSCFNGTQTFAAPTTGECSVSDPSFNTIENCNTAPCAGSRIQFFSPNAGDSFQPGDQVSVQWAGGIPDSYLLIALRDYFGNTPSADFYTAQKLAYVSTGAFSTTVTLPSTVPSGAYYLSIDVLNANLETTGVTDNIKIHVSSNGITEVSFVTADTTTAVDVTFTGTYGTTTKTLTPSGTISRANLTMQNIGEIFQVISPSSNLKAIAVFTDQGSASYFVTTPNVPAVDCSSFEECYSCIVTSNSSCGWCEKTQLCLPNLGGNPVLTTCSAWSTDVNSCVAGGCSASTTGTTTDTTPCVCTSGSGSFTHQIVFAAILLVLLALF